MKINDINSSVNEGILDAFKKPSIHQLTYKYFIDDFVDDAVTSLSNGINYKWIDPSLITSDAPETSADDQSNAKPTQSYSDATGKESMVPNKSVAGINSFIKKAASEINKVADKPGKLKLVKELVNFMADRHGSPEWDNAIGTVSKIIKNSGVDTFSSAIQSLKSGKVMTEHWRIMAIAKLLAEVKITMEDLNLSLLTENNQYYIADKKYIKLNSLFENIIKESSNEAMSIAEFMESWFDKYMHGVNWRTKEKLIMPVIKQIEQTYKTDKGMAAIKKLASIAYDVSGPTVPSGAKNAAPGGMGMSQGAAPSNEIVSYLKQLKTQRPAEFAKIANTIKSL